LQSKDRKRKRFPQLTYIFECGV